MKTYDTIEMEIIQEEKEEPYTLLSPGKTDTIEKLPVKIKNFFGNDITKLKRNGSYNNKLSFYACILNAFDNDFYKNNKKEKSINEFKSNMLYNLNHLKLFDYFCYKNLKWKKKDIVEDIHNNNISFYVVRFIMDFLNINIIILDLNNEDIYIYYPEEKFDIHKNCIILTQYCNNYELITHDDYTWSSKNPNFITMLKNTVNVKTLNFDLSPKKNTKIFDIQDNYYNKLSMYMDSGIYFLN